MKARAVGGGRIKIRHVVPVMGITDSHYPPWGETGPNLSLFLFLLLWREGVISQGGPFQLWPALLARKAFLTRAKSFSLQPLSGGQKHVGVESESPGFKSQRCHFQLCGPEQAPSLFNSSSVQ